MSIFTRDSALGHRSRGRNRAVRDEQAGHRALIPEHFACRGADRPGPDRVDGLRPCLDGLEGHAGGERHPDRLGHAHGAVARDPGCEAAVRVGDRLGADPLLAHASENLVNGGLHRVERDTRPRDDRDRESGEVDCLGAVVHADAGGDLALLELSRVKESAPKSGVAARAGAAIDTATHPMAAASASSLPHADAVPKVFMETLLRMLDRCERGLLDDQEGTAPCTPLLILSLWSSLHRQLTCCATRNTLYYTND